MCVLFMLSPFQIQIRLLHVHTTKMLTLRKFGNITNYFKGLHNVSRQDSFSSLNFMPNFYILNIIQYVELYCHSENGFVCFFSFLSFFYYWMLVFLFDVVNLWCIVSFCTYLSVNLMIIS